MLRYPRCFGAGSQSSSPSMLARIQKRSVIGSAPACPGDHASQASTRPARMTSATYSIRAMTYQPAFPEAYVEKWSRLVVTRVPEQRVLEARLTQSCWVGSNQ